jgi:hypothetical protein
MVLGRLRIYRMPQGVSLSRAVVPPGLSVSFEHIKRENDAHLDKMVVMRIIENARSNQF